MLDCRCQSIVQGLTNGCVHVCDAIVFGTRITLCIHRDCLSRIMNRGVAQDTTRKADLRAISLLPSTILRQPEGFGWYAMPLPI